MEFIREEDIKLKSLCAQREDAYSKLSALELKDDPTLRPSCKMLADSLMITQVEFQLLLVGVRKKIGKAEVEIYEIKSKTNQDDEELQTLVEMHHHLKNFSSYAIKKINTQMQDLKQRHIKSDQKLFEHLILMKMLGINLMEQ